jgi:hypothetical protein
MVDEEEEDNNFPTLALMHMHNHCNVSKELNVSREMLKKGIYKYKKEIVFASCDRRNIYI